MTHLWKEKFTGIDIDKMLEKTFLYENIAAHVRYEGNKFESKIKGWKYWLYCLPISIVWSQFY